MNIRNFIILLCCLFVFSNCESGSSIIEKKKSASDSSKDKVALDIKIMLLPLGRKANSILIG